MLKKTNDLGVTTYLFNEATIRLVQIDGNPWFVAKDVCEVLGINTPQMAYRRLDAAEIHKVSRADIGMRPGKPAALVSESGLYKLIMRSDKPVAKPFQDWVTREVLPAIRKDGMYVRGDEKVRTGEMSEDELILRANIKPMSCYRVDLCHRLGGL
jgi:prophage antirepressor-like protein